MAMLACARIGAVHSVVFGGFAPHELAKRIDDARPKLILSASCGIEVNRVVPYKPLLDQAIELAASKPERCVILQRPHGAGHPGAAARPRLGGGHGGGAARGLRARGRHRPALHPLHLGHHRHPQGRRARQRRPRGGPQVEHEQHLRGGGRRHHVHRLRHRLGGRPLVHRVRPAAARGHQHPLRGQAGGHARSRGLLAAQRPARRQRDLHGAHRLSRHQEGGPAGHPHRPARPLALSHAVPGRRALRSRHPALGGGAPGRARDRPLVADGDGLAHRRQLRRPRHAAREARLADEARAGLRRARGRRAGTARWPPGRSAAS